MFAKTNFKFYIVAFTHTGFKCTRLNNRDGQERQISCNLIVTRKITFISVLKQN